MIDQRAKVYRLGLALSAAQRAADRLARACAVLRAENARLEAALDAALLAVAGKGRT